MLAEVFSSVDCGLAAVLSDAVTHNPQHPDTRRDRLEREQPILLFLLEAINSFTDECNVSRLFTAQ